MGGHQRRDQRFVGDSAQPQRLTDAQRREILSQLSAVRRDMAAPILHPDRATETNRVTGDEAGRTALRAERTVRERQERGTLDHGLADATRVLRSGRGMRPSTMRDAAPLPAAAPSRRPTPLPGVDPALSQRVEHAIGPDPGSGPGMRPVPGLRPAPQPTLPTQQLVRRNVDALDELNNRYFRSLYNDAAQRLTTQARSRHDAPLRRLRSDFERLMGANPEGIRSRREWERARDLFDEAYERARDRWNSQTMWNAVYANPDAVRRLEALERAGTIQLQRRGARLHGAPRIQEIDVSGNHAWVAVNIDHAVPLDRNPWGVLARDNLVATTPSYNQQFLNRYSASSPFPMRVDRFGGAGRELVDRIEDFVIANGLSRQRRATATELATRYGPSRLRRLTGEADAGEAGPSRRQTSDSGQRVIRGLMPALNWALELLLGDRRRAFYRDAVMELRRQDRERRRRRESERSIRNISVEPQNMPQTFARVVGDRNPLAVYQLGDLVQRYRRWLDGWDGVEGEGWRLGQFAMQALLAPTQAQRNEILGMEMVELLDITRGLGELIEHIDGRLGEDDYDTRSAEAQDAADAWTEMLETEAHSWAIDIEDAEYLSRGTFQRLAWAYRSFADSLRELRGLVTDTLARYRRVMENFDAAL